MKLIYGIARNSRGEFKTRVSGKAVKSYVTWNDMLRRCYDPVIHEKFPTYIDCTVDPVWHDFQDFAKWYVEHEYSDKGYQIDKDILIKDSKVYSPDTCCFVPHEINSLFTNHGRRRGEYPQGVSFHKASGSFVAQINMHTKVTSLGLFDCPQEAQAAYVKAKEAYVKEKALEWRDRIAPEVFEALMSWTLY